MSAVAVVTLLLLAGVVASASGSPARAADSTGLGATVPGPLPGSSVTVDQVRDLIHQRVQVSWKGFKPTTAGGHRPVRIYQCQLDKGGTPDVSSAAQCLGNNTGDLQAPLFGLNDGPPNFVDSTTGSDGTGLADMEVRTPVESSHLGCTTTAPCALVVVPAWAPQGQDQTGQIEDPANWKFRTVIPISFQELPQNCAFADADVRLQGSPLAGVMMSQWNHKTCINNPAVNVDYTNLGEPRARANFLSGVADVALTSLPASAADGTATRAYAYAPVNVTSLVVAFVNDDSNTGKAITTMKLNPRLLAKLITESYGYVAFNGSDWPPPSPACPAGQDLDNITQAKYCSPPYDKNVTNNPLSLFADPEFLKLNPGANWNSGDGTNDPLLFSGNADFTYELTRYIESDADARAFLAGTPDPWGMRVNTAYKGISYPANTFELRDPSVYMTYSFQPLGDFTALANNLIQAKPAGAQWLISPDDNGTPTHLKFTAQPVGFHSLVAIMDSASAAALRLPTAQLQNAAGSYVAPDSAGMTAAEGDFTKNSDGVTRQMNYTAKDAAAYPLTMETYAMVATSKLSSKLADKTADLLDFAAGPGQTPGVEPGDLPPGYVPLAASEIALTKKAADEVRKQSGATPPVSTKAPGANDGGTTSGGTTGGTGSSSDTPFTDTGAGSTDTGTGGSADTPQSSASPSAANSIGPNKLAAQGVRAPGVASSAGFAQLVLPLLLLLGLVACGVGPLAYLLAKEGVPTWMKTKPTLRRPKPPTAPPSA